MASKDNLIHLLWKKKIVVLDGAMGTMLQREGLPVGVCPEIWALSNKNLLTKIYQEYILAGSEVIYTFTFGANRRKLNVYNIQDVAGVNRKLAYLAKQLTVDNNVLVAGDIGPLGDFVEPLGPINFEEAIAIFKEQARGLIKANVDLIVIETMIDIQEARAALIAVKEISDIFTIVSLTFEEDGKTLNGTDPVTALVTLQSLGADAVGCNCSAGPEQLLPFIEQMKPYSKVPLLAKPNAGLPVHKNNQTFFPMQAKEFGYWAKKFVKAGVNFLGGCCGTTPLHIKEIAKQTKKKKPILPQRKDIACLSSLQNHIIFENNMPLLIVGESINPTGKRKLKEALKKGDFTLVRKLAREQKQSGASLLDVNSGIEGIDEPALMKELIKQLSIYSPLPLVIDSSNPKAIEAALRLYPGRALINSLSAKKESLKKILPLIKKYGAMAILLPLEDKGLPRDFIQRKRIINNLLKEAKALAINSANFIIDGLVLTWASNPQGVFDTLATIEWCKKKKFPTIIGLSNISFGMPNREWINSAFLALAQAKGLTLVIANPCQQPVRQISLAINFLLGRDKQAKNYLSLYQTKPNVVSFASESKELNAEQRLTQAIIRGDKEIVIKLIDDLLAENRKREDILSKIMIPAMNEVEELFKKREYFLPQLLASAEAMKLACDYVLSPLAKTEVSKATIILATVKGDIHDIGKNIVGLMLKNHGFNVVDLGKDVSKEKIVQAAIEYKASLIGLSALMTTTMGQMEKVIKYAAQYKIKCLFLLGGAVVTKHYADSLGAYYARDGIEAVHLVEQLILENKKDN